jgi:hypothetical protein
MFLKAVHHSDNSSSVALAVHWNSIQFVFVLWIMLIDAGLINIGNYKQKTGSSGLLLA